MLIHKREWGIVTRLTLDKQAAFSEQGSKNIEALSGDTI